MSLNLRQKTLLYEKVILMFYAYWNNFYRKYSKYLSINISFKYNKL